VDRIHLQVMRALASTREAHHGYEWRDVPKEDEPVGSPQRHAQVLHLVLTQDCQTHVCPCAFRVVIVQVVDDHVRHHVDNQRDQQDYRPAVEPIAHHHPTKDQDWAPQGLVDQYVQSQLVCSKSIIMFKVEGIIEIDDHEEDIENKFYVDGN